MFKKFRQGRAFKEFEEDEFLKYLAKVVNTSHEQLCDTYISSNNDDFQESLRKVMGMISSAIGAEDNIQNLTKTKIQIAIATYFN